MQLNTINASKIEVSDTVFASVYSSGTVHQVVNAYIARSHTGTHAAKTRAETRGGGRKPYRQKGTGRARRGSLRSPLARGGGVIFPPRPIKTQQKVNQKMYRVAMRSLVSKLVQDDRVMVVQDFTTEPKTKAALKLFAEYGINSFASGTRLLVVVAEADKDLDLATRNLPHVLVCTTAQLNPLSLVLYHKVLISVSALKKLEERLS